MYSFIELSIVVFQTILELALNLISYLYKDRCCYITVDVLPIAKALQLSNDTTFLNYKLYFVLKRFDLGRNRYTVFFKSRYSENKKWLMERETE